MQQTEQIHYKNSIKKTHKHEILLDVQIPHAWNKQKQYHNISVISWRYSILSEFFKNVYLLKQRKQK
jgi:hypothetical protein